jgi:hypothetical protein
MGQTTLLQKHEPAGPLLIRVGGAVELVDSGA